MPPIIPGDSAPWLEVTNIDRLGIWLLVDNEEFFLPYEQNPWFYEVPISKIFNIERPTAHHIRWPDLDVDLELDAIRYPEQYPLIARQGKGSQQ